MNKRLTEKEESGVGENSSNLLPGKMAGQACDRAMKWLSLVCLTVQNAALVLTMRYTRTQPGDMFLSSTAVIIGECTKLFVCLGIVLFEKRLDVRKWYTTLYNQIIQQPVDTIKVAVPSFIYTMQNNLLYVAVSHLDAATFQVTYQLKILTTAMFSVLMLRKSLAWIQWAALVVLFAGVSIVQLEQQQGGSKATPTSVTPAAEETAPPIQNPMIGLLAVVAACVMSGFSGVYFERILKSEKTANVSIWVRNIQLSIIGIPIAWVTMEINDGYKVHENGFFFGYTSMVWCVVLMQALGGLLVAVVVKYADNILKGFASSLAIIISCIFSVWFFDFNLTLTFSAGVVLVIASVFMYGRTNIPAKSGQISSIGKYESQPAQASLRVDKV